jgi:hypothetical protein
MRQNLNQSASHEEARIGQRIHNTPIIKTYAAHKSLRTILVAVFDETIGNEHHISIGTPREFEADALDWQP